MNEIQHNDGEKRTCSSCACENDSGANFCKKCSTKISSECPTCWVKKQPYNCGHSECPGYRLLLEELHS